MKILVAIAFLIGLLFGLWLNHTPEVIDDNQAMIRKHRKEIERLNEVIESRQQEIDSFTAEALELRALVDEIEQEKRWQRRYYENKINDIDTFTISGLDSFFSERYRSGVDGSGNR